MYHYGGDEPLIGVGLIVSTLLCRLKRMPSCISEYVRWENILYTNGM